MTTTFPHSNLRPAPFSFADVRGDAALPSAFPFPPSTLRTSASPCDSRTTPAATAYTGSPTLVETNIGAKMNQIRIAYFINNRQTVTAVRLMPKRVRTHTVHRV